MFGPSALAFDVIFALAPLLALILLLFIWKKNIRAKSVLYGVPVLIIIAILWVPLFGGRLYFKSSSYLFLKTLEPSSVVSISVGSQTWIDQEHVRQIVQALHQAEWHVVNHDPGGPYENMIIILYSGAIRAFHIGRYYDKDAALVEFFRSQDNGYLVDGDVFAAGFPSLLQSMGHNMPSRTQR